MKGEDVMAVTQTGTGKTAAFAIPIINKIHATKRTKRSGDIRGLVMVPTRELAVRSQNLYNLIVNLLKDGVEKNIVYYKGNLYLCRNSYFDG